MTRQLSIPEIRWVVRILAIATVGFVLLIYVGEGGFNSLRLTANEAVSMLLFWTAVAGLVVAWKSEWLGGAMTVGGMLLFYGVHRYVAGTFPRGWAFAWIALPGALFLGLACLESCRMRRARHLRGSPS